MPPPSPTSSTATLSQARRREGRYLLRTNLTATDPAKVWQFYLQSVEVEAAFKTLKSDLAIRPVFHQDEPRMEAYIFIAFLAYCLHVALGQQLKALAPGLTPRAVPEKFAAVQMIDRRLHADHGRTRAELHALHPPEPELKLLLEKLNLTLARPIADKNHHRTGRGRNPRVLQTF